MLRRADSTLPYVRAEHRQTWHLEGTGAAPSALQAWGTVSPLQGFSLPELFLLSLPMSVVFFNPLPLLFIFRFLLSLSFP